MKILFIAPLPPPITGHSLVSKVLLDDLEKFHEVEVINLSKNSFKEGIDGFKRIMEVVGIIKDVWKKKRNVDVIYLTISESFAGNVKDLFIYLVCLNSLSRIYIHLHGGSIKRLLWDKHSLLLKINKIFIKRFAGAIITGESHSAIFKDMLPPDKIHIIPNFAQNYLFVNEKDIRDKFSSVAVLRILYMSNLIPKKGYNELIDAFLGMSDEFKSKLQIDFAGAFESDVPKNIFLNKIKEFKQITYHGIVDDAAKKQLFSEAHIFCLPTSYYEGQPISILEAYAVGCVVVTTGQSGILDIFQPGVNGFVIEQESPDSIREVIVGIVDKNEQLEEIGFHNWVDASRKYRISIYTAALKKVLES